MTSRSFRPALAAGLMLSGALLAAPVMAAVSDPAATPAQWHSQKVEFTYTGFTTYYTCDGLEGKVRYILLAFGARKDAKVQAVGCDRGFNRPSRFAWVRAEFSTLTPAAEVPAGDTVQGVWTKVQLAPNKPTDMGWGECELVEQMWPTLQKSFALRNTDYRSSCVPKQLSIGAYNVRTEVLQLRPVLN